MLLTPILFGTWGLDETAAAIPMEFFVALIGIVLLTPVFAPEQDDAIAALTGAKPIGNRVVALIRIGYSFAFLCAGIGLFSVFLLLCGCTVPPAMAFGTMASGALLGSIGMLSAAVCQNTAIAYTIPLLFYALNFTAGSKLGVFYIFCMTTGHYTPKLWQFAAAVVFVLLALGVKKMQNRLS